LQTLVEVVLVLVALILVSIGFAVTLGMLLFGSNRAAVPASTSHARAELEDPSKARARFESELLRKQKELDEQRTQLQEVKEQLKQTKRKLFDQKEGEKGERDLIKARVETERHASVQLEAVRVELANALAEIERLRSEQGGGARARRAPAAAPAAPAAAPAQPEASAAAAAGQISAPAQEGERVVTAAVQVTPAAEPAEKAPRRYRELNDADREKMERLEHTANKERSRATELERDLRKLKGAKETQQRIYNAVKGELDLVKDKYKALEKRMNRTLLERDLLRRAIKDLEKKTGMLADRTELTPDEVAASDQRTEDAAKERAAAESQRAAAQAQAEAEATKAAEAAATASEAAAAPAEAPAPAAEADKSTAPSA
jgi:chromosome segregation ATPase